MTVDSSLATESSPACKGKRTSYVLMTDEARVLRELRLDRKLSMQALGAKMGKSDSLISQIENGRLDVPKDHHLERYLAAIEGISIKSFHERVRRYKAERRPTDREELFEIINRASDIQARQILVLAQTILASNLNLNPGGRI